MSSPLFPPITRPTLSSPNPLLSLLSQCNSINHFKQIHSLFVKSSLTDSHCPQQNHLLSFCCSQNDALFIQYARQLFDEISQPNTSSYNTIIKGYSNHKSPFNAVLLYLEMLLKGLNPDSHTFPCLLKSFNRECAVKFGDEIHAHAIKFGFWENPYVQNVLIHMYSMSGEIDTAREIFDRSFKSNTIMWNAMISGYCKCKHYSEACKLFKEMQRENVSPSLPTFISVISACAKSKDLSFGKWVHRVIEECGVVPNVKLYNALIDMYAMCGDMFLASKIFDEMEERDVVSWTSIVSGFANSGQVDRARTLFDQTPVKDIMSWTSMINAYVHASRFKDALDLFRVMQENKLHPDEFTIVSLINACAQLGALEIAEWIRVYIQRKKIKMDTHVVNAFIDMYCKCGSVDIALNMFRKLARKDKFSWTSIINGLAINGNGEEALELFNEMSRTSTRPDEVTFIGVLTACTHSGLVDKGREYFYSMITAHNIAPNATHYGCLVDLLSRAGQLKEALETIHNMPMKPNSAIWGSLLGACVSYKNVKMAELACNKLLEFDTENDSSACYVLLSNVYAKCDEWAKVREVREMMMKRGMKKEPGCSMIEMNGEVHEFVADDCSHPKMHEISLKLKEIEGEVKLRGYAMDASSSRHSEKLALAFGLVSLEEGARVRIVKNLRICVDCHDVMKLVSRIYSREIVVRDRTRFHHFKNGLCSCKNFW